MCSYLEQPWFEGMIYENVKSQDLKELATILRSSARSTCLVGVHQVRVCGDKCLDNQILHKDTGKHNDIWCVFEKERD